MTRLWPDRKSITGAGFAYCGIVLEYKTEITPKDYSCFTKELETHNSKLGIQIGEKLEKVYRIRFNGQIADFESTVNDSCTEGEDCLNRKNKTARKLIEKLKTKSQLKNQAEMPQSDVELICDNLTECINIILK